MATNYSNEMKILKSDFTLRTYRKLLETFIGENYSIIPYEDFHKSNPSGKILILRHDVDKLPLQSLKKAKIENELGIRSTYYFRIVPESNQPIHIKAIASLGHEIGYHYEDLTIAKGDTTKAKLLYEQHLKYFREFYPVSTICMHGSPTSKWDNRLIWKSQTYKTNGIVAEPYFDINFNEVLYITDTGRSWDGSKNSVRDKVHSPLQEKYNFDSSYHIMKMLREKKLPEKIMINTHPQRWQDGFIPWCNELITQNIKNLIKRYFFVNQNEKSK